MRDHAFRQVEEPLSVLRLPKDPSYESRIALPNVLRVHLEKGRHARRPRAAVIDDLVQMLPQFAGRESGKGPDRIFRERVPLLEGVGE